MRITGTNTCGMAFVRACISLFSDRRRAAPSVPCTALPSRGTSRIGRIRSLLAITALSAFGFVAQAEAAVDKVYFANEKTYTISRANLDGSSVQIIHGDDGKASPKALAVDGANNYVYFIDTSNYLGNVPGIYRASLGTIPFTTAKSLIISKPEIMDIALYLDQGKIYYSVSGSTGVYSIFRANLDGSNIETVVGDDGQYSPQQLVIDPDTDTLFFFDSGTFNGNIPGIYKVGSLSSAGLPISKSLVVAQTDIKDLAVSGGKLYYSVGSSTANFYGVKRANLDGSSQQVVLPDDGVTTPQGIVIDDTSGYLFYTDNFAEPKGICKVALSSFPQSTPPISKSCVVAEIDLRYVAIPEFLSNSAPTDIALSSTSVNQSGGTNATVGTLSTTDADSGDTHTYSLVSGTGSTHNSLFNISGTSLRANNASTMSAGSYSIRIRTTDAEGATYEKAFTITVVDNVAPSAPSAPNLDDASDTGSSNSDNITNDTTPTFTGTGESGATVTVFNDANGNGVVDAGESLGTGTVSSGAWSVTATTMSSGTYTIKAIQRDAANNTSGASAGLSITIDTTAPAAPTISAISTDTGSSNSDGITSDNTLSLSGTAEANAIVALYRSGIYMDSVIASGAGTWSYDYTGTTLNNGSHSFTATATDTAGNTSTASSTFAVTVDTTAPTGISGTLSVAENAANGTAVGTVSATDATVVTFSLTDNAGGRFNIASNGNVTVANGTLLDYEAATSHDITVRATDAAGNVSDTVLTVAITNVNEAPASAQESYSVDFAQSLSVDAARGVLANDSDMDGDTLSAVLVSGPASGSLTLNSDGSFSYSHNGVDSADDSFTYQATDGSLASAVTTVSLAVRTVSSDPGVLTLTPRVARFAPVTVGGYGAPLLFTLKNGGSSARTIGAVNFGGPSAAEFSLQSDGCSGQSLGAGASCTVEVSFAPTTTGSKAATLEVNTDELESPVRVAFLTNAEGAAEVAERRLPPVLRSYVLYPEGQPGSPVTTLTAGTTYTLEWVVLGYADGYLANAAMFDCRAIVDGSCGDQYDDAERFDASGNLSPAETANGDWSYGGELARAYTYRYTFTVPAARFTSAGDIVLRFYQKSVLDAQGGLSGVSLLVPGGVAERYYDNAGRRIIEEVVP